MHVCMYRLTDKQRVRKWSLSIGNKPAVEAVADGFVSVRHCLSADLSSRPRRRRLGWLTRNTCEVDGEEEEVAAAEKGQLLFIIVLLDTAAATAVFASLVWTCTTTTSLFDMCDVGCF